MCGIVGYIGDQDVFEVIIGGLEKLEYRGYDSAGIAVFDGSEVIVTRAEGKLRQLKNSLQGCNGASISSPGIGHTRWATHGKPSETNAHPHTAGRISLIHNGIIENYMELRERLQKGGSEFQSETDTEIAAHLLNHYLNEGMAPFDALRACCNDVRGSYAFLAIDVENPDRILVAKNATPIVIGLGDGEVFIASDIPAILGHTREVVILEDGDLVEVKRDSLRVENKGKKVERPVQNITWDPVTAQKGGFKHYMLKEIHDQSRVVADSFRGRIELDPAGVALADLGIDEAKAKSINRIVLLACGTAWHACLVAKFYIEEFAGIPCEVDYSSEFRYRQALMDKYTLVIAVSQSGETADTLAAMDMAAEKAMTLGIVNVLGSSIARKVEHVLYTHAGPEISVASTKAFVTQLVALYLLAIFLGEKKGTLAEETVSKLVNDLVKLPGGIDETLHCEPQLKEMARTFHLANDFLYIGRGICYPIALEGALKLKEISYIHAEGYPAGELKHGPIALIEEKLPVVVVLQKSDKIFEKTLSNLREVESRGGKIIAVTDTVGHPELHKMAEVVIELPYISEYLSPVLLTIPLQLLAYYIAVRNGTDVDLPRNLAKSVTVE